MDCEPENRFQDEEIKKLSRGECCKILGLPENADDQSVKTRYGALLRQYKKKVDEYGTTYDDLNYYRRITAAYDTVFGFSSDFSDDNPTSIIPYKYRRKWGKFLTWLDQYKLAVILACVIIFLGIMFVIQRKNAGTNDIKIKFVGAFQQNTDNSLSEALNEGSEVFDNCQVTFFTVTTETSMLDNSARTGAESFLSQLMSPGGLDVVLIDRESFDVYVASKSFLTLDEFVRAYYNEYGYDISVLQYESDADEDGSVLVEQGIYGIDVTDSAFIEGLPINWLYDEESGQERSMIFAIARKSKNVEVSWSFCLELLGK